MTDMETLRAMLDRVGIPYTVRPTREGFSQSELKYRIGRKKRDLADMTSIKTEESDEHPLGYPGFYTEFIFDGAGALVTIAAYE